MNLSRRRRVVDGAMTVLPALCVAVAVLPLVGILYYVVVRGAEALDWEFLTSLPKPVGQEGGGMGNAILGSAIVVGLAAAMGIPIGLLAGIFLAETGKGSRLAGVVRFFSDVMQGVPSIVTGIVAYTIVVLPMKGFSAYAGAVALAMMLIPFITRTTEEALLTVGSGLREAALALGQREWRVLLGITLRAARGPVTTGILLGIARIAGETAPLLFTALGSRFWPTGLGEPIATLTVTIYQYAIAPFDDWNRQAWAGALVLILGVLLLNGVARLVTRSRYVERS